MKRRAFTLVELLVVIAIISILITIVTIAARGALSQARQNRRDAMCKVLEQAIAAYYAQEGVWPDVIEAASKGSPNETVTFGHSDTDRIFQQVVGKGFGKSGRISMLLDATGLYVCEASRCGNNNNGCNDNHSDSRQKSYCGDQGCRYGIDFADAVKKGSKRRIAISNMAFGYSGAKEGRFRRFFISYNCKGDTVTVFYQ